MAIPAGLTDRQKQSFVEDGTGVVARNAHITGGTLASITGVVGTVNVIAILGTITSVQTIGTVQAATVDMVKAGTFDMVKNATVNMLKNGTLDMLSAGTVTTIGAIQAATVDMVKAGTIDMVKAATIDMLKNGTIDILSAGTITTVGMIQDGTLSMVKAGTIDKLASGTVSMLSAGTITTVAMVQAGTLDMLKAGSVTLSTLISGEDQTNDVMKVEGQFSGTTITSAGTTNGIKTGVGLLHAITINNPLAGTHTIVDGTTSGSGGTIATILVAATGNPFTLTYDRKLVNGLSVIIGATADISIMYR